MTFAKSAKTHPAAKKICDWEEPAICGSVKLLLLFFFYFNNIKNITTNNFLATFSLKKG